MEPGDVLLPALASSACGQHVSQRDKHRTHRRAHSAAAPAAVHARSACGLLRHEQRLPGQHNLQVLAGLTAQLHFHNTYAARLKISRLVADTVSLDDILVRIDISSSYMPFCTVVQGHRGARCLSSCVRNTAIHRPHAPLIYRCVFACRIVGQAVYGVAGNSTAVALLRTALTESFDEQYAVYGLTPQLTQPVAATSVPITPTAGMDHMQLGRSDDC